MRTDTEVLSDVTQELHWDPMITADGIGASVRDGIVTLVGHVPSYPVKIAAERAAARVNGVRAVVVDLEVRLPTTVEMSDAELAARAARALEWHALVRRSGITIQVEHSWITLTGHVARDFQRAAAERAVNELGGLRGLTNSIVVSAPTTPRAVAEKKIEDALTRRGDFRETVP
jgi:osmotically-inducible protein OsmY